MLENELDREKQRELFSDIFEGKADWGNRFEALIFNAATKGDRYKQRCRNLIYDLRFVLLLQPPTDGGRTVATATWSRSC